MEPHLQVPRPRNSNGPGQYGRSACGWVRHEGQQGGGHEPPPQHWSTLCPLSLQLVCAVPMTPPTWNSREEGMRSSPTGGLPARRGSAVNQSPGHVPGSSPHVTCHLQEAGREEGRSRKDLRQKGRGEPGGLCRNAEGVPGGRGKRKGTPRGCQVPHPSRAWLTPRLSPAAVALRLQNLQQLYNQLQHSPLGWNLGHRARHTLR